MAKVLEEKETTVPELDIEGYATDDAAEVLAFLQEHPALVPVLAEAISPVRQVFGDNTLVALSLLDDHDSDDDLRLIAGIRTTQTVAEARELRNRFYRNWWNANIHRGNNRLFFDMDFVNG